MKTIGKITAVVILLLGFISGGTFSAFAADGGSYESNGKVGFYGEWNPPKEKEKEKEGGGTGTEEGGSGGEEGTKAGKKTPEIIPDIPVDYGGNSSTKTPRAGLTTKEAAFTNTPTNAKIDGTLPQTGMSPYVTYAGIALLLLAHLFLVKRRRKDSNNT